jgi:hypothetical protein
MPTTEYASRTIDGAEAGANIFVGIWLGRELGQDGLEAFTELKAVTVKL